MASKSLQDGGGNVVCRSIVYETVHPFTAMFSPAQIALEDDAEAIMKSCTVLQGLDKVWTSAFEQDMDPS